MSLRCWTTDRADYQIDGVDFIFEHKCAALWWRMGRGKTITTAAAVAQMIDLGMANRALVVAPKRVATKTWPQEFKDWDYLNGVRTATITGTAKQREDRMRIPADFNFISWNSLPWLVEKYKEHWPFDTIILDESSKIKTQGAWWKAMCAVRPKTNRVIQLTGSPSPNGLQDVWAPMYVLDKGMRLGRTMQAYKSRWFFSDMTGKLHIKGKPAEREIHGRLTDIVYALRSVVTSTELIHNTIKIDLPPKIMATYKKLEKDAYLEVAKGDDIDAFNAAALTGKLLQFASGAVYTTHPEWEKFHDAKLDALEDVVDESEGRPLIVAYNHKHELQRVLERFPHADVMDKNGDIVDKWNSGDVQMLVMHPAAGGHGLNMQYGGSTIVWFSLNWSLELFEQLIARLYGRRGQREDVINHMLVADNTLDQEVQWRLEGKYSVQEALMKFMERAA